MLKGFRSSLSHDYLNGIQGIWSEVYTKIGFHTVLNDTSGRYDPSGCRWTPVLPGEEPRYVMLGAQLVVTGVRANMANCNCKVLKNATAADQGGPGHFEANMPTSGINGPIGGRPGQAGMQTTLGIVANPGDYFEVWAMVTAAAPGEPPLQFEYHRGCIGIDPHYGHSYFWGVVADTSALDALATQVAGNTAALAILAPQVTGNAAALKAVSAQGTANASAVASLTDQVTALAARITALEHPPDP
jgi:hypothetical protein